MILNDYLPVIKNWPDAHFTTLTIRSIPASRLPRLINKMNEGFQRIKDRHRKRGQRGNGVQFVGIKSLECNFNPEKKTYNPHFHIIFKTKEMADTFKNEWLKLWTERWAMSYAQKTTRIYNSEKALIETVKYGSKIFTEPDLKKKAQNNSANKILYVAALDTIFMAMKGHRIFERFGFNLPKKQKTKGVNLTILENYKEWLFNIQKSDWENPESEELLTGYITPFELDTLLNNGIDSDVY
jgi:hypothetical protein